MPKNDEFTFLGMLTGGDKLRADYILREQMEHLLASLMPSNRLALTVSLTTGLRINDVLALKTSDLKPSFTVKEQKTGKKRHIRLSKQLLQELRANAGSVYVFPHRLDPLKKHRTRQAVWKDLKRASDLFRLPKKINVTPHSTRKIYAVGKFHTTADIRKVQSLLNHSSEAVTWLYVSAEILARRKAPQLFKD